MGGTGAGVPLRNISQTNYTLNINSLLLGFVLRILSFLLV